MCVQRSLLFPWEQQARSYWKWGIFGISAQEHCISFPKNPHSPSRGEGLWRCVPLGAAEPAVVSTPARRLREHQGTPPATEASGAPLETGGNSSDQEGKGCSWQELPQPASQHFCEGLLLQCQHSESACPGHFPPVTAPPLHSPRVSSPGPQLINSLELINICGGFFLEMFIHIWGCWRIGSCNIRLWMGYQTLSSKPSKNYFWALHCVCFLKYSLYSHAPKCLP